MKIATIFRILSQGYFRADLRRTYWRSAAFGREILALFEVRNTAFRRGVIRDHLRFCFSNVSPVAGETEVRQQAAVDWLLKAQAASPDDGVSLGYFPCNVAGNGWRASYPETTGYIISTLLEYARRTSNQEIAAAALRMTAWEMRVQMPSGAVQGGAVCAPAQQTAAAFNTGMVLDGLCSAYAFSGDKAVFEAARRAADFLVNDLDESKYFKTNGAFVSSGEIKTYTCLCAWAIYRFGELANQDSYRAAAVAIIEAALAQQQANGWFSHNCLTESESPLTHTIGYTLQGILEVGILARRPDFVAAVQRTVDNLILQIASNGFLAGRFFSDWQPAGFSSCLTGSAQIAIVNYRLSEQLGVVKYRNAADKLLNYLKSLQLMRAEDNAVVGALGGSFPLFGAYMRAGYPNWATKYYLDALMLQRRS